MADKVTWMVLKVDLHCPSCYKKIKKILCKFPEIRDQVYDEKKKEVKIAVVCCCPEKIKEKLLCKGGKLIISIDILPPPKPPTPTPPPPTKPPPTPPPPPKVPVPVIPIVVVPVKPCAVLGGFCCPHGCEGHPGCDSCNHGCEGRGCDPCNHGCGCGMPATPRRSSCNRYNISGRECYVWEDYCSQENTGACRIM